MRNRACALTVAASLAALALIVTPGLAEDWSVKAKDAFLKFADEKKDDVIKEQAKEAIIALYAKLYKSGANRTLSRSLAEVAISAPDLEKIAEETGNAYASGNLEQMRAASEKVAVKFGEQLTRLASNRDMREQLGAIIGKADKVAEIASLAGAAAGSQEGREEAEKFIGEQLINLTPGAAVVSFYEGAYGVMKYVNNKYADSVLEQLYQQYASGDSSQREDALNKLRNEQGSDVFRIINSKKNEIESEKKARIADAAGAASDKLLDRLTATRSDEVVDGIIASFDGRIEKERNDRALKDANAKAADEFNAIVDELEQAEAKAHGPGFDPASMKLDLAAFASLVRDKIKADGVLDPDNLQHIRLIAALEADRMAFNRGAASPEYAAQANVIETTKKGYLQNTAAKLCNPGSPTQRLAERLWSKGLQLTASGDATAGTAMLKQSLYYCDDTVRSQQLAALSNPAPPPANPPAAISGSDKVERTRTRLSALNYTKLQALFSYMNISVPAQLYACLCQQIPHTSGVSFVYDPKRCTGGKACHFVGGFGDYCVETPVGGDAFKTCEAAAGVGYKSADDRGTPISQYIVDQLAKRGP